MWEPHEPRSIVKAAEEAAAAGNYVSAETLLREAARLQEASLGPLHPDLANTLNNLGVVCEITNKPVDAEQYFRRAFTIATAVLDPDHPFVATSGKNLRDFCEARGKQVELPASTAAVTAQPQVQEASAADPPRESQVPTEPSDAQVASRRYFRRLAIDALGPIAMLIAVLAAIFPRHGSTDRAVSSSAIASDSKRDIATAHASVSIEPGLVPTNTPTATNSGADKAIAAPITSASTVARPIVVRARLCADLDEWRCDPPDRPVPPGPLFFYTQVKSTSATTVQHRWYWDDRLNRSIELRVEASPTEGYRTYSRNTMKSEHAGSWRVELRSKDGALLHEERFSVR
jgi:hypothetical protein